MIKIKIKGELVVSYWPPKIGPLTPPPTFAVSSPGTGAWLLAHPRNDPRPSANYESSVLVFVPNCRPPTAPRAARATHVSWIEAILRGKSIAA